MFAGESFFVNSYTNNARESEYLAFATHTMARILPLDLSVLGDMLAQSKSYFASVGNVQVTTGMVKSIGAGLFGGEGLLLQKLSGTGLCFITAGGTPVQRQLRAGETVYVDAGCLVAFQSTVSYKLKYTGSIRASLFGGEGVFMQRLTGPGLVILESLPNDRLIRSLQTNDGGKQKQSICRLLFTVLFLVFVALGLHVLVESSREEGGVGDVSMAFRDQWRNWHVEL
jgi:uncharacterized protein (AIM24 family)